MAPVADTAVRFGGALTTWIVTKCPLPGCFNISSYTFSSSTIKTYCIKQQEPAHRSFVEVYTVRIPFARSNWFHPEFITQKFLAHLDLPQGEFWV